MDAAVAVVVAVGVSVAVGTDVAVAVGKGVGVGQKLPVGFGGAVGTGGGGGAGGGTTTGGTGALVFVAVGRGVRVGELVAVAVSVLVGWMAMRCVVSLGRVSVTSKVEATASTSSAQTPATSALRRRGESARSPAPSRLSAPSTPTVSFLWTSPPAPARASGEDRM